jgi:hypothetical protein
MTNETGPVAVYGGSDIAVGYVQGLLQDAGLTADLWDEHRWRGCHFGNGGISVVPVRVVRREDMEKARPIVERFEQENIFKSSDGEESVGK